MTHLHMLDRMGPGEEEDDDDLEAGAEELGNDAEAMAE